MAEIESQTSVLAHLAAFEMSDLKVRQSRDGTLSYLKNIDEKVIMNDIQSQVVFMDFTIRDGNQYSSARISFKDSVDRVTIKENEAVHSQGHGKGTADMNVILEPYWSLPYLDTITGQYVITYYYPFRSAQAYGNMSMSILYEAFKEDVSSIDVYKTGYAQLINEDKHFIVHPYYGIEDGIDEVAEGKLEFLIDVLDMNDVGTVEYTDQGINKILSFYKLENGWTIIVFPPYEALFKPLKATIGTLVSVISLIGLFFIGVAWYIGGKITTPLLILAHEMDEIAVFSKSVPESLKENKNEAGELANAISDLQEKLNKAFRKIEFDNNNLEQEIYNRTRDLEKKKRLLEESLATIKKQELEVLDKARHKSMRILLQNLSERLIDPALASLEMTNFLVNEFDAMETADIINALQYIEDNHRKISYIVQTLIKLYELQGRNEKNTIDIETVINKVVMIVQMKYAKRKLDIDCRIHLKNMYIYAALFEELIKSLLEYSLEQNVENEVQLGFDISETEDFIQIVYDDFTIKHVDRKMLFELGPGENDYIQFIEMYVIKDIVERGFEGSVALKESDHFVLSFKIPRNGGAH